MDVEEENMGPFRRSSARTRRMASALARSDNRAQAALARLEPLESDNARVEVVDHYDDEYGSIYEEDLGQAALARLEALESDNAWVEVGDHNDDEYESTDDEDPGKSGIWNPCILISQHT